MRRHGQSRCAPLYDYAWFVGFGVAFAVYTVFMRGTPVVDLSGVREG